VNDGNFCCDDGNSDPLSVVFFGEESLSRCELFVFLSQYIRVLTVCDEQ